MIEHASHTHEPIERPCQNTLADRVYNEMLKAIISGDLPLGTKLNQLALARRFGTSRGPLREAIERLEARRLVTRTAHVGARVIQLSIDAILETFYIREALEGMAARLAATRMTDDEILALEELLNDHEKSLSSGDSYPQDDFDMDFHYLVITGAKNQMIRQTLCEDLYYVMKLYRAQNSSLPGRAERAILEHRRVVDAIKDRDGEVAELMMRRHISNSRSALHANLAEHEETSAPIAFSPASRQSSPEK